MHWGQRSRTELQVACNTFTGTVRCFYMKGVGSYKHNEQIEVGSLRHDAQPRNRTAERSVQRRFLPTQLQLPVSKGGATEAFLIIYFTSQDSSCDRLKMEGRTSGLQAFLVQEGKQGQTIMINGIRLFGHCQIMKYWYHMI